MSVKTIAAVAWFFLAALLLAGLVTSVLVGDYIEAALDAVLLGLSPTLVKLALLREPA